MYPARIMPPERGWTAWFLELTYDVGAPTPLKLATDIVVTPDFCHSPTSPCTCQPRSP